MARSSDASGALEVCFLEHQLVKPLAGVVLVGLLVLVGWVGLRHVSAMPGAAFAGTGQPLLGLQLTNPDELVARMFAFPPGEAVLIERVLDNGAAARAGLQRGDGIAAVNGQAVRSTQDIASLLSQTKQGDLLTLTVIRGGLLHDLLIPLGGPLAR